MRSTAHIIWSAIGLTLTVILLWLAMGWGFASRPIADTCVSLRFIVTDSTERMYFGKDELPLLLQAENVYPVGQPVNRGTLHRIEEIIRRHPMVRTAECYLTPRNEMKIKLSQRVPLLRVQNPGESYFIDTDRRVMPYREAVKDSVLTVTGSVGVQTAASQLADFALWLQDHSYWRTRIHRLHMNSPVNAVVIMDGQRVVLGSMRHFERKLKKLRSFIEESPQEVKDKQYKELDLRFRGQVIGRKAANP